MGPELRRCTIFGPKMANLPKWEIFFRKLVNRSCSFHSCLSGCQKSINEIMTIKEYWNLIGQEPFLAITCEPDFSQACSLCRMLINHKNFCFTQIPDKTNNVIFQSPKTLFCGHFWQFLVTFAPWGFFTKKNLALSKTTIYGPQTPC